MNNHLTRRRFITISAAIAGAALVVPGLGRAATPDLYRWRGRALGAQAEILLNIPASMDGGALIKAVGDEISRLEQIFSLYQPHSALVTLNQQGYLRAPPIELVDLLTQARAISQKTKGAFDVTVQPLWQLHEESKGRAISKQMHQKILGLVDHSAIILSENEISFDKGGMAVTLNGIAQGYITDRVTRLLASYGLENSLVQLGETRALGGHPDGHDWQVGLQVKEGQSVMLRNQALATSGGMDASFVFDPRLSQSIINRDDMGYDSVSVVAPTATLADGLSTAFSVMPKGEIVSLTKEMSDITTYLVKDGVVVSIKA